MQNGGFTVAIFDSAGRFPMFWRFCEGAMTYYEVTAPVVGFSMEAKSCLNLIQRTMC